MNYQRALEMMAEDLDCGPPMPQAEEWASLLREVSGELARLYRIEKDAARRRQAGMP